MTSHNRNTAILLTFLAVPFGLAIHDDATASEEHRLGAFGYGLLSDEMAYAYDDPAMAAEAIDYGLTDDELAQLEAFAEQIEPERMDEAFFREVLASADAPKTPGFFGPLRGIHIGDRLESLERHHPGFEDWGYDGIPGYGDVSAHAEFAFGALSRFQMVFPDDGGALQTISQLWGPADTRDEMLGASWFVPSKSLRYSFRSEYGEGLLQVSAYQTLEQFVAPTERLFGFETSDVFELEEEELQALFADDPYGDASVAMPPLEESSESARANYELEDGRVVAVEVGLVLDLDQQERMLTLLTKKLGAPEKDEGAYETVYRFRQGKRIIEWYVEGDEYCSFSITRR